jgi:DNA-directed RNA polymerase subunit RPC12/RpoP
MIQIIVTYRCGRCESPNLVRNGHDYKGSQKYHCKDCGRYGMVNAQSGYDTAANLKIGSIYFSLTVTIPLRITKSTFNFFVNI